VGDEICSDARVGMNDVCGVLAVIVAVISVMIVSGCIALYLFAAYSAQLFTGQCGENSAHASRCAMMRL